MQDLDVTPKGRNESGPYGTLADWVRPRNMYGSDGTEAVEGSNPTRARSLFRAKNVNKIDSSANWSERKQAPRIHVNYRKHSKAQSRCESAACLGCKRSRVQIPAARPLTNEELVVVFEPNERPVALDVATRWPTEIPAPNDRGQ